MTIVGAMHPRTTGPAGGHSRRGGTEMTKKERDIRLLDGTQSKIDPPRCSHPGCNDLAVYIETVHWDTGNTKGVSFFPYCARQPIPEHADDPHV